MAETEKKYLDHIQYTGKKTDGTKAEKQDLYFKDSEARVSITEVQENVQNIQIQTEENKSASGSMTIPVDAWVGDDAPFYYDFGERYTGKTIVVGFDRETGTDGQLLAFQKAVLVGGSGTKMYATGEKPVTDIPVIIQVS